jgi:hypothetical protein
MAAFYCQFLHLWLSGFNKFQCLRLPSDKTYWPAEHYVMRVSGAHEFSRKQGIVLKRDVQQNHYITVSEHQCL